MTLLLLLVALAAGTANPFQSGTNAELNKQLGSPMWAAVLVYSTGLAALLLMQIFVRGALPSVARMATVPWWAWLGGTISIISTVAALMTAQRLGSGVFTGASITASLVTSVLLDHFGLIGFTRHPASPLRVAGCAVMVAGLWMVAKF
jgi:transporter family-2 protein